MSIFRRYEQEVITRLCQGALPPTRLTAVLDDAALTDLEYTEIGYFVTATHDGLPSQRTVCNKPLLIGYADGLEVGFVVFLENKELTLECHSWSGDPIPQDMRERAVIIAIAGTGEHGQHQV